MSVSRNASANLIGKAWATVLNLAILPYYARLLGYEAYGLVGFYASLQAVLSVLDLGLAPTLARSLSELNAKTSTDTQKKLRPLVRTFALFFSALGVIAGVIVAASAHSLTHWVHRSALPAVTVERSIILMGVVFAAQWPGGLFLGGLMALEKQVVANVATSLGIGLRAVTTLVVLHYVSRSPEAFFVCQASAVLTQTVVTYLLLERALPAVASERIGVFLLLERWRFAGGTALIALFAAIIVQADKIILSRTLALADFGRYALASAAASVVGLLVSPIIQAVYPRLVVQVTQHATEALVDTYHATSRWTAAVVLPIATTMAVMPHAVLLAWSGDAQLATSSSKALALLATSAAANAIMNAPYYLQLAHESTRIQAAANAVLSVVLVPLLVICSERWGATGAAGVCALTNCAFAIIVVGIIHRRILVGEASRWYVQDVGLPLFGALIGGMLGRLLPLPTTRAAALIGAAATFSLSTTGLLVASRQIRRDIMRGYSRLTSHGA